MCFTNVHYIFKLEYVILSYFFIVYMLLMRMFFISEFYCSLNSLKYISFSVVVPSGGKNRRVDGKQINTKKFYSK